MKLRVRRLLLALSVAGVAGWSATALAQIPPAAGRFLVATPTQQGFFAKSVILLITYGSDGALGIVVNHPTTLALARVLPDPGVLHGRNDLLYVGGPVSLDALTMLIRTRSALPASRRILAGIYASESLATLHAAVSQKLVASRFRAYAGYAGWAPGQLDSELEEGAWTIVPADAADVFTSAPAKLWSKLNRQGSVIVVKLDSVMPVHRRPSQERLQTQPVAPVRRESPATD